MLAILDYRVRQRDFLLEISRAITARLNLNEVLRLVLNASAIMLTGQSGLIALRDETGDYQVRAVTGIDPEHIPELNSQLRVLIESATARDTEELNSRLRGMAQALDPRLKQTFALPLSFGGEATGLLIVFRDFQGGATPDDIQVLQSFADQAAIAVHNAQLYERISLERKQLGAIVQHSADGVMILDATLRILSFNRALERMTAWSADDAIGKPLDEVLVFARLDRGDLQAAIDEGWPYYGEAVGHDEILYTEGDLLRLDGLTVSVGIRYAPLFSGEGKLANIIANVRDITNFRQAQEMQNVFISTVSHELKTPVALIKGYAATLRRDDVTWDESFVREYSGVIEEEADRLTELIENLLTASRIQAERGLQLNIGEVRLDELAARCAERLQTQTERHPLVLDFPPDFPYIPGDEVRLRQVLENLISNAIKYSPDGGDIIIEGRDNGDSVTIIVRDQGVGLIETDMERIFDRFFRVDGALSRKTQGTGLGLYLAKAIVEAHGGAISVESTPTKGSTFQFRLPKS
jgi:PAS domain S-box-containing protein